MISSCKRYAIDRVAILIVMLLYNAVVGLVAIVQFVPLRLTYDTHIRTHYGAAPTT